MRNSRTAPRGWILAAILLVGIGTPAWGATQLLERIVAVVNDDVVLYSELQDEMQRLAAQIAQADMPPPPAEVLQEKALERVILRKLQLAEAARLGLTVDDETVAQALANIAENNGLSVAQLRAAIEADGMSFMDFRENLREQILVSRLRNREVTNRVQVTKAEIDNLLATGGDRPGGRTDFHILHLLVATRDGASPQQLDRARDKAEALLARLRNGADFRSLAQAESDGRQALQGGDLGWLSAEQVPTLFAEAVATLERGGIAGPIRSSSGFHIIELEDYKGAERAIVQQTHARHILIRTSELTADDEARQRLERLRSRIIDGDDFDTLARSNSDDRASAIRGGDLGWLNPGDTVPRFEEEMGTLAPGEVSEPFKTDFGWHIVQVLERRNHDATDEVLRAKARAALRDRKAEEAMELYLRRLRDEAYVEVQLADPY
jgi:peptidyl-prolyl cis-trans isomerase SurA